VSVAAVVLAVVAAALTAFTVPSAGPSAAPAPNPTVLRVADPVTSVPAQVAPADDTGLLTQFWVDGTSTIAKLGSRLTIGRGRFDANIDPIKSTLTGTLTLPPSAGYFVVFRFVPATNTTYFTQDGKATGTVAVNLPSAEVHLTLKLFITLKDVRQDNVDLKVGDHCTTVAPATIPVNGTVQVVPGAQSQPMHTTYTIPPFAGCGTTENLDPLLTNLISGAGNELTMTLTSRCVGTCPPD
jgi:hypothetical protein